MQRLLNAIYNRFMKGMLNATLDELEDRILNGETD